MKLVERHWGFIIGLLSILAGAAMAVARQLWGSPSNADNFSTPLIFTWCSAALGFSFRAWCRVAENQDEFGNFRRDVDKYGQELRGVVVNFHEKINQYRTLSEYRWIMRTTSSELLKQHNLMVNFSPDKFLIDSHNLAVRANILLWKTLTDFQSKNGIPQIKVKVTHTTEIQFWDRTDARRALHQQADFVAKGGKVIRIIKGPFSSNEVQTAVFKGDFAEDDLSDYARIILDMLNMHIEVRYFAEPANQNAGTRTRHQNPRSNDDFLVAEID